MTRGRTDPAHTPVPIDGDGEELIGVTIDGRYRLEATLGRGGMGLVYRAAHVGLRRNVAVKILHPALAASPEVRNRFEREALAVGKIDHVNCVAVYDVGRLPDGALYLAMELLEGRSLSEVLEQEGQLAPGRALHILRHILRGLAHVHASGLIHRDMKPENIFLVRQDDDVDFAKILDFGIAKPMKGELSDDGVKLTQAGMAFGTPIYMAPEQALGNPLDGRADLYAAAVMGYEMLCGQPPFYSDDKLEVMSMHTARPVPPMRQRLIKNGRPVPSSIEKLIVRGLTKKPSDRYDSAEAFLAKVENALETPDGGQTEVNFERPTTTGSLPLVSASGRLRFEGEDEPEVGPSPDGQDVTNQISNAIDEVLSTQPAPKPKTAAAPVTPTKPRIPTTSAPLPPRAPAVPSRDKPPTAPPPLPVEARPRTPTPPPPLALPTPPPRAAAGVGIGLPYTGPHGEPIFGLTPEQRLPPPVAPVATASPLATPSRKKPRWPLYAGIIGAAVVAGVVIAVATLPGSPSTPPISGPAKAAQKLMDQGSVDEAITLLEGQSFAIVTDGKAQLVLGNAYATRNKRKQAIDAFEKALRLSPELETDEQMRANLYAMTAPDLKDKTMLVEALDLWLRRTTDSNAKKRLASNAIADAYERRAAVRPVITRFSLEASIDRLSSFSLDLDDERMQCPQRLDAVLQLRTLNDPRAIPALERAIVKTGKLGAQRGKPINLCLVDQAKAAISYLKARGAPSK